MERESMSPKLLGIILLVVGVILLVFGWNSSQSLGDQVTETITGRFTDETMWFIIGGAVAVVVGAFLTLGKK
jgi:di/tricarboxylate transporter